jgi:pilus assembly protein CpaE
VRGIAVIRVLIADEIARIVGDLEKLKPFADDIDVCGVAHLPAAVVEEAWLRQPDVLVIHESFAEYPAADFAAHVSTVSPATRIVLMSSGGPKTAEGWVSGWIGDSADGAALAESIRIAAGLIPPGGASPNAAPTGDAAPSGIETSHPPTRTHTGRASVIVVFSGKGGTGTSMVATNLAVALAAGAEGRAALIDTDLQFGDAAGMLHVEGHLLSIADLAPRGDNIDGDALDDVLATGPSELRVLRSPSSPELASTIDASNLRAIIRAAAKAHHFLIVDTPSHLDERALEAFELADRILLVTSYNVSSVRSTKATLLLLDALGIDRDRVEVVLNHTRQRVNYRREDVEAILGCSALVDLPHDPRVDPSLDAGTPIVLAHPRAELSRRLLALALLIATPDGAESEPVEIPYGSMTPSYRRRFSLGRR